MSKFCGGGHMIDVLGLVSAPAKEYIFVHTCVLKLNAVKYEDTHACRFNC